MDYLSEKFKRLGIDNAAGQEERQQTAGLDLRGDPLPGPAVNFSHGDVDAHEPTPGALDVFVEGYKKGGCVAYTVYRGSGDIRKDVAKKLAAFTGAAIDYDKELILTPGTQGALFLALGCLVGRGDKVAIVEPDYFDNRKLVEFFDGELISVKLDYLSQDSCAGVNLSALEESFKQGVKLFLFSNPNNPTGVIYSEKEIRTIAALAKKYNVTLIVDELYSRQIFENHPYTHLRALAERPDNLLTIMGPSKTESLSGFRLGTAFGTAAIIDRMEKLQAIVTLRAPGYCQYVFKTWFNEPKGWLADRIIQHQQIRDDLVAVVRAHEGCKVRKTEGGSYIFPSLPPMDVSISDFAKIVRKLTGVAITPGTEFGPQFIHNFRVNFSQDHDDAIDAVKRVMDIMERYRSKL
jgi:aspartate/methionine/tyrosine aminotransferase